MRGGIIPRHRAMAGLAIPRSTIAAAAALGLGGAALMLAALNPLAELWARFAEAVLGPLGLAGGVGTLQTRLLGGWVLDTPYYLVEAPEPGPAAWRLAAAITATAVLATFLLPARFTPLRYFVRFLALVQGTSLAFFALAPAGSFPYTLSSYTGGLLGAGQVVLVLLPVVLAFTFYLFDIRWSQKVGLTLMLLAHLAVLIPLQVTVHAWLVARASLVVLPPLFLFFGLLVQVMVFVAFYGWGMSWRPAGRAP